MLFYSTVTLTESHSIHILWLPFTGRYYLHFPCFWLSEWGSCIQASSATFIPFPQWSENASILYLDATYLTKEMWTAADVIRAVQQGVTKQSPTRLSCFRHISPLLSVLWMEHQHPSRPLMLSSAASQLQATTTKKIAAPSSYSHYKVSDTMKATTPSS